MSIHVYMVYNTGGYCKLMRYWGSVKPLLTLVGGVKRGSNRSIQ